MILLVDWELALALALESALVAWGCYHQHCMRHSNLFPCNLQTDGQVHNNLWMPNLDMILHSCPRTRRELALGPALGPASLGLGGDVLGLGGDVLVPGGDVLVPVSVVLVSVLVAQQSQIQCTATLA